jgi:putative DNA modification/repair radical SAM protein
MELRRKLTILADAAKYDASCASSGAKGRNSLGGKGVGSVDGTGICHAYTPDGRCVSLLKILLTNWCMFDCAYCVNRNSSNVPRARFTVQEVVRLTIDFYKRNYTEGLFLSSGIVRSADYTMEQLVEVARTLREEHDFRGYIHLKTIPEADPLLVEAAGRYADRLSCNIELPREQGLARLAPQKSQVAIRRTMAATRLRLEAARGEKRPQSFAPAGQSTQMIVGADGADDREVLARSAELYGGYKLRRVYYSAFSPIPDSSAALPLQAPPLRRENRLYQADWLFRFYGFTVDEILAGGAGGMLELGLDPKLAWALKHRERFPIDLNRACREDLLRVPGLGRRNVERILQARRHGSLRYADLARLRVPMRRASAFLVTPDHRPRRLDSPALRRLVAPPHQLSLLPAHA